MMSEALYEFGGLRFWNEKEIQLRESFQGIVTERVKESLLGLNPAWRFARCEGPSLTPKEFISSSYSDEDIFCTNHKDWALRAETTASSYQYAKHLGGRLPLCVYQSGKSFRREQNDGASAAKLRFNEFWQLEFQCIYAVGSKADYRGALIAEASKEIGRFTGLTVRTVDSDRLPSYSESTIDIEVQTSKGWREIASCSIRTDYKDALVCEIAIGLDRLASLAAEYEGL